MSVGIGKRELLEDYYMDEIGDIFEAWNALHKLEKDDEPQETDAFSFLGDGGEWV